MGDKPSLNFIRYHYFLDSSLGVNRERYAAAMKFAVNSTLDWLAGVPNREAQSQAMLEELVATNKTEEELDELFKERKARYKQEGVPKPVPNHLSEEETRKRNGPDKSKTFPSEIKPFDEVLAELDNETNPSIRFNEHFLGEQHPFGLMPAMVGGYLGLALNENAIAQKVSPSASILEHRIANWLTDLVERVDGVAYTTRATLSEDELMTCGLIPKGNIVGGGTVANLTALLVARNKILYHKFSSDEK